MLVLEVVLTVSVVEEGVVEVEEEGVTEVVERVLDDGVAELVELVTELAVPTELVDVEGGVVVPPDEGAEAM